MDQDTASNVSQQMANGVAAIYQAEQHPVGRDRLDAFRSAAFYLAYEFIPDSATALVLTIEDAPLLVAVDGDRFYKLGFAPFNLTDEGLPTAICDMQRIRPELAGLTVETLHHEAVAGVLTRTTAWNFSIDGNNAIAFQSQHTSNAAQSKEEQFARALFSAIGWEGLGEMPRP